MQFTEDPALFRDPSTHDHHCQLLEGPLSEYYSTTYGVNRQTSLNSLSYFHVCELGLPPDIMHDVLEGYLPYTMKLMLHHAIRENFFSLHQLNTIITNFEYGYLESANKPSLIAPTTLNSGDKTNLGQSGKYS